MNVAANSIPAFCLPPFVDPALLSDVFTADNIQLGTVWARSEEFPEYAVSCNGQVMRLQTGLVLRPDVVGNGYMRVSLYRKGRASRRKVHRLVASAFIPNPSNKPFVNHEDGDKIHNRVVNLAWATSKKTPSMQLGQGSRVVERSLPRQTSRRSVVKMAAEFPSEHSRGSSTSTVRQSAKFVAEKAGSMSPR